MNILGWRRSFARWVDGAAWEDTHSSTVHYWERRWQPRPCPLLLCRCVRCGSVRRRWRSIRRPHCSTLPCVHPPCLALHCRQRLKSRWIGAWRETSLKLSLLWRGPLVGWLAPQWSEGWWHTYLTGRCQHHQWLTLTQSPESHKNKSSKGF